MAWVRSHGVGRFGRQRTRSAVRQALVLSRLDKKADDGFFAERLGSLQAVRPSMSTKRARSARTRIGVYWPLSRMLAAILFPRF
jgi:hypothetical protein